MGGKKIPWGRHPRHITSRPDHQNIAFRDLTPALSLARHSPASIRLPPIACPNLPMDCPLMTESGAAEAFAALDKIAMLGACASEDEPWGRFGRLKALSGVEGQANGGKRMSVGVAAGVLPA
jgi:hypothetical protein